VNDKNVTAKVAVLIVGTGPAGGTAALARARLGIDVMVINKYPWTAPTSRSDVYGGWRAESVSADATDRLCAAIATVLAVPAKAIAKQSSKDLALTVT
jgi:2-polyprenyl-6-methoxyphenol hydroxylase-like FAD-dependent oxidoreductase